MAISPNLIDATSHIRGEPVTPRPQNSASLYATKDNLSQSFRSPVSSESQAFYESLSGFNSNSRIEISLDPSSGRPVMKVTSEDGQNVIIQIPTELSLHLEKVLPSTIGLLKDTVT